MDKEEYEVFFQGHLIGVFMIQGDKRNYASHVEGVKEVQDTISKLTKEMFEVGPITFFEKIIAVMKWWHRDEICYPDRDLVVRRKV